MELSVINLEVYEYKDVERVEIEVVVYLEKGNGGLMDVMLDVVNLGMVEVQNFSVVNLEQQLEVVSNGDFNLIRIEKMVQLI